MVKYGEFQTFFYERKTFGKNISPQNSSCLLWELTFISFCNVKASSEMSSFYKKDFVCARKTIKKDEKKNAKSSP